MTGICMWGKRADLKTGLNLTNQGLFQQNNSHIRIMIPNFKGCRTKIHYKRKLNALERLLLLQYQPEENRDKNGHKGHNEADSCLNYIMGEVRELATDADAVKEARLKACKERGKMAFSFFW